MTSAYRIVSCYTVMRSGLGVGCGIYPSINQSIKTLIQVDKPQRGFQTAHLHMRSRRSDVRLNISLS